MLILLTLLEELLRKVVEELTQAYQLLGKPLLDSFPSQKLKANINYYSTKDQLIKFFADKLR